jgi:hypothetical protein
MEILATRFRTIQALQAAIILNMLEVEITLNPDQAHKALIKARGFKFSGVRKTTEWDRRKTLANRVCQYIRKNSFEEFVEFSRGGTVSEGLRNKISEVYGRLALSETDELLCAVQDSQRY